MKDAKEYHKIRKLIILTGEENDPARRLYESFGKNPKEHYALMFGANK
jgi:hypothetical protein